MRIKVPRQPTVLLLVITILSAVSSPRAADIDGNGLNDSIEPVLAERFKPAFILHDGRSQGPEPVNALTRGDCLRARDLFMSTADMGGGATGTFQVCDLLDGNGASLPMCSDPDYNYANLTGGVLARTLILPGRNQSDGYQTRLLWEYGGPGNESGPKWKEDYLGFDANGDPHTNPYVLPGSTLDPTAYATIWNEASQWRIQYYMYYPYNDWIGNHEGDWESVVVTIDSPDPETAQVIGVRYYNHHNYIDVSGGNLLRAHLMAETHPVVYVGGSGDGGCGGGEGEGSGASWPAHGDWFIKDIPWPCPDIVETVRRGVFIPYQDVRVELWPNVQKIGASGPGVGAEYFDARPCEAWKRADVQWGAFESPSPGDAIPFLDAGNKSPRGPLYQSHWHDLTPDGFEPFSHALDPLLDQRNSLFIVLEAGDGGSLEGEVILDGSNVSTPFYGDLADGYDTFEVTVPEALDRDGQTLAFRRWHDGSTLRTRSFGTADTTTLGAQYGEVQCGDEPLAFVTNEFPDSFSHTCPAGDGGAIRLRVRFNPNQIAGPLSAESITVRPAARLPFWGPVVADGPATAANNYTTTITIPKVSGCASTLVEVLLYGCPVGEGYVRVKSYDAIPNGSVDMSEIAVFSETIGTCSGDPKFNSCYDFNGDSCIDLSDIALFSGHDGHSHPVAPPED